MYDAIYLVMSHDDNDKIAILDEIMIECIISNNLLHLGDQVYIQTSTSFYHDILEYRYQEKYSDRVEAIIKDLRDNYRDFIFYNLKDNEKTYYLFDTPMELNSILLKHI